MSRDDPARHLLRAARAPDGAPRPLSAPTGMARMRLEERAVPSGAELTLSGEAGAEGFLYVLEGRGTITCAAERLAIGPGDFLGLAPGEVPVLCNTGPATLTLLVGFGRDGG